MGALYSSNKLVVFWNAIIVMSGSILLWCSHTEFHVIPHAFDQDWLEAGQEGMVWLPSYYRL